ncbi:MAG: lysophospholipase [Verrucomicrobia bacterium]|nr:lysophospholipase [Verrucomicrobiota bacterium]
MKKEKILLCAKAIMGMAIFLGAGWAGAQAGQNAPNPEPAAVKTGDSVQTAGGHWEGEITLPGMALEIRVDLSDQGAWTGSIDIPVQGLRGFELGNIQVQSDKVSFVMPRIPGDPTFVGKLSDDRQSIAGEFSQGKQTHPFHLNRTVPKLRKGETPGTGVPGDGFAGVWQGGLNVNVFEMRLVFDLKGGGSEISGTMVSLDQNVSQIPISKGVAEGRELHLELKTIGGMYDGRLNDDGSQIVGEWRQGGNTFPLKIVRLANAPDLSRPQDPKKPYPYNEEEVVFPNLGASIQLAGTLTHPKGVGPHPAVVLVSGSGKQDRDEALMGHRPFLVLADHLTRNGIAVLRFDDRGAGKSEGRFSEATTADFTTDALAAVEYLKTRGEIDPRRIGIAGHSEGGLVAPQAAVQSDAVAFIVLLAGVGVPMDQLLARQAEDIIRVVGGDAEVAAKQGEIQRRVFDMVRAGQADLEDQVRAVLEESLSEFTADQLKAMGINQAQLDAQVQMVTSKWFRELLATDPRPTLERVKVPVLAINGKKDVQVAWAENLGAIEAALKKGGNSRVQVKAYPNLNHLFQTCKTGAVTEYGTIEETINEEVLRDVSNWIRRVTGLESEELERR